MDAELEFVVLPAAGDGRAKALYQALEWRMDAGFAAYEKYRVVQFIAPGSPASVMFGARYMAQTRTGMPS